MGSIALSAFINAKIPSQPLLHLAITGVAAVVAVIGIGIHENAAEHAQITAKRSAKTDDDGEPFATPRTAQ